MKAKSPSRIMREMHESASDLHSIGLISKRRMAEFDALCHLGVPEMPPKKIKSLREASKPAKLCLLPCSIPVFRQYKNGKSAIKNPAGLL
jgi:putative transcriptional regulator